MSLRGSTGNHEVDVRRRENTTLDLGTLFVVLLGCVPSIGGGGMWGTLYGPSIKEKGFRRGVGWF